MRPSPFSPHASALLSGIILAFTGMACVDAESITCDTGIVCPADRKCSLRGDTCIIRTCGNGIQEAFEDCDDGNDSNDDGCRIDCTAQVCGDRVVQSGIDEQCDDGNTLGGDGCSADCKSDETCGNGVVDHPREACDDGNTLGGDGCSENCLSTEKCGDGVQNPETGEVCDDHNLVGGDGCSEDCRSKETCGNRIIDRLKGEVCDDGNTVDGDRCSASCLSTESCGNGVVDTPTGELCDDGNVQGGDGCSSDCRSREVCGDGAIDRARGEVCDDGNTRNGDGCSSECTSVESCGNGVVDETVGEICDDGNNRDGDGCSKNCRSMGHCGDGFRNENEQCDDGNRSNSDGCLTTCIIARCGDGYVNTVTPPIEACDDGNADACGTCNSACSQEQPLASSKGSIEVGGPVQDGEVLALGDGHVLLFFEFDTNNLSSASHIRVNVANNEGKPQEVAGILLASIQSMSSSNAPARLRLEASRVAGSNTLELETLEAGASGNQPILESVKDEAFKATALSGGAGWDCPAAMGCTEDHDCIRVNETHGCLKGAGQVRGLCGPRARAP